MEVHDVAETSALTDELERIASIDLTEDQMQRIPAWCKRWKEIVFATGPSDRRRATDAIHGLYRDAGLSAPAVAFVPSPLTLAFANGIAAGLWHWAETAPDCWASTRANAIQAAVEIAAQTGGVTEASRQAMVDALREAIGIATKAITWPVGATAAAVPREGEFLTSLPSADCEADRAVECFLNNWLWPLHEDVGHAATGAFYRPKFNPRFGIGGEHIVLSESRQLETQQRIDTLVKAAPVKAASEAARFLLECAEIGQGRWCKQFTSECAYLSFLREVSGWSSPQLAAFAHFETLAETAGPIMAHPQFCMVAELPTELHVLNRHGEGLSRLHNESGPACRWADGWTFWYINGVHLPDDSGEQIVMRPQTQTIVDIDSEDNEEVRRIRIERFGWMRYLRESNAEVIDARHNDMENTRELLCRREAMRMLVCHCPSTARVYALEVPGEIQTCEQAQQWLWNTSGSRYGQPRIIGRS